jgi:hypothetical protein
VASDTPSARLIVTCVHLVYPHGNYISCPDAIGRRIVDSLRSRYEVKTYDWDDVAVIEPGDDDVLLGHPHPAPWTIFRRSVGDERWRRRIAIFPFSSGDRHQSFFAASAARKSDELLLITGPYWAERLRFSAFSHWVSKAQCLDLAVDRVEFPRVKASFNPAGLRKWIYIGNSSAAKNPEYLEAIAARLPAGSISWAGEGRPIDGLNALGYLDFSSARDLRTVAEHDFLLTVGKSDANPATILESMSWGLVPVCTPESGYAGIAGIVNVPLDSLDAALGIMHGLQYVSHERLDRLRRTNDHVLNHRFTWDRFLAKVLEAVERPRSSVLIPEPTARRVSLAFRYLTSQYSPLRPSQLRVLSRRARTSVGRIDGPAA